MMKMMRIGKCCGAMLLMDKLSGQCEKILTMQPRAEMGTELLKRASIVAKMCFTHCDTKKELLKRASIAARIVLNIL